VETVRHGFDAWNRGDIDAFLACFVPDATWHTSELPPDESVYRGHAGIERVWSVAREDLEEPTVIASELRAVGDKVFAAVTLKGRGKRSRAGYEQPFWYVMTCRDGLVVRLESYLDGEQAVEAAELQA
jgi:ketosteroid isomerase-like protein